MAYLEPCQNGFRLSITFAKRSIIDVWQDSELRICAMPLNIQRISIFSFYRDLWMWTVRWWHRVSHTQFSRWKVSQNPVSCFQTWLQIGKYLFTLKQEKPIFPLLLTKLAKPSKFLLNGWNFNNANFRMVLPTLLGANFRLLASNTYDC